MGEVKLASAGDDIKIWDCSSYSLVKQFNPHEQNISGICWNQENTLLSSVSQSSDKISLTAVNNNAVIVKELECGLGKHCVDFNSTSRYVLCGGEDQTVAVWDLKTGKAKKVYKDHKGPVTCAKFNWNDTHIASGSTTGEIILYNVLTGQGCSPLIAPKVQGVKEIQFSRHKKALLGSVSDDGAVNLWDTNTRRLLHSFTDSHRSPATGLNFSPINNMLLMSVGLDKRIVCYDVQGKKPVKTMMAESPLTSLDVMSNGAIVAVGSTRGKIFMYDLRQGSTPMNVINAHKSSVQCLKFQNSSKTNESAGGTSKPIKSSTNISPPNRRQLPTAPANTVSTDEHNKDSVHFSPELQTKRIPEPSREDDDIFSPIRDGVGDHSNRLDSSNENTFNYKGQGENTSDGVFSPLNNADLRPQYSDGNAGLSYSYNNSDNAFTSNYPTHSVSDARPHYSESGVNSRPLYSDGGVDSRPVYSEGGVDNRFQYTDDGGGGVRLSSEYNRSENAYTSNYTSNYSNSNNYESNPKITPLVPGENKVITNGVKFEDFSHYRTAPLGSHQEQIYDKGSRYVSNDGSPDLPSNKSPRSQKYNGSDHQQKHDVIQNLSLNSLAGTGVSASPSMDFHSVNKLDDSPSASAGVNAVSPSAVHLSPEGAHAVTMSSRSDKTDIDLSHRLQGAGASESVGFHSQFIRNIVREEIEELRDKVQEDVVNLQVEMIRQFQIQLGEIRTLLQHYSVNEQLLAEVERLQEENKRLKKNF